MSLTPAFLDELRMRTSLSTLIGRTTKVQKAGREYKACCPFQSICQRNSAYGKASRITRFQWLKGISEAIEFI